VMRINCWFRAYSTSAIVGGGPLSLIISKYTHVGTPLVARM
jgi:hypothetical protein